MSREDILPLSEEQFTCYRQILECYFSVSGLYLTLPRKENVYLFFRLVFREEEFGGRHNHLIISSFSKGNLSTQQ